MNRDAKQIAAWVSVGMGGGVLIGLVLAMCLSRPNESERELKTKLAEVQKKCDAYQQRYEITSQVQMDWLVEMRDMKRELEKARRTRKVEYVSH